MKFIQFKTSGAMLESSHAGTPIRKNVDVAAEVPFSEETLQRVEAVALPGTVRIIEKEESEAPIRAEPFIRLADRTTGRPYEVFVENGQLMMEVI